MNKEFEQLISSFYDIPCEEKKSLINKEFKKIEQSIKSKINITENNISNKMTTYDETNSDTEDQNLTKIYNDILILEENINLYMKEKENK